MLDGKRKLSLLSTINEELIGPNLSTDHCHPLKKRRDTHHQQHVNNHEDDFAGVIATFRMRPTRSSTACCNSNTCIGYKRTVSHVRCALNHRRRENHISNLNQTRILYQNRGHYHGLAGGFSALLQIRKDIISITILE